MEQTQLSAANGIVPPRNGKVVSRGIPGVMVLQEHRITVFSEKEPSAMTTLTEQEVQHNMRAVAHAIGQQELEGLKVPESTVADLCRAARGEIDTDEVIRNIYRRCQNASLLRR